MCSLDFVKWLPVALCVFKVELISCNLLVAELSVFFLIEALCKYFVLAN